jgi:ABC-type uncharacterized transport system permease subunit
LLLAAIGELVVEKTGVLNLGVEGMMIIGAVTGFIVAAETGSIALAFLAGMAGGMILAAVFGGPDADSVVEPGRDGLALTLFGIGLAALLGVGYPGPRSPRSPTSSHRCCRTSPSRGRSCSATPP